MQVEPALVASSSQSRVDVIAISMSAVLALTGLQWLALKPKPPVIVELDGQEVQFVDGKVSKEAVDELKWCAYVVSLDSSIVVFHGQRVHILLIH